MKFQKITKKTLLVFGFSCSYFLGYTQGVAISNDKKSPHSSAMLDISAVDKGLLIPRVALQQADLAAPITDPAPSLLVFNTNPDMVGGKGTGYYYNQGDGANPLWVKLIGYNDIPDAQNAWVLTGNEANEGQHFLGTTNNSDLILKSRNIEGLRISRGGALVAGNYGDVIEDVIPAASGTQLMWLPGRHAFRAGAVNGNQWNADFIGKGSFAVGTNTTAAGLNSFAAGSGSSASSDYSVAMGQNNTASGISSIAIGGFNNASDYSVAFGNGSSATSFASAAIGWASVASKNYALAIGYADTTSGIGAFAIGFKSKAANDYSMALGAEAKAIKNYAVAIGEKAIADGMNAISIGKLTNSTGASSVAMGYNTQATANYATSLGVSTIASGTSSIAAGNNAKAYGTISAAFGYFAIAKGSTSIAAGERTEANAYGSATFGIYNDNADNNVNGNATSATDRIFQIGNGSAILRKNALTILKNGNIGTGGVTAPDAQLHMRSDLDNSWESFIKLENTSTNNSGYMVYDGTNMKFKNTSTNGKAAFRFYNSSDVEIASLDKDGLLLVDGNIRTNENLEVIDDANIYGNLTYWGNLQKGSDNRLKENIAPLKSVVNKLKYIQPVYYNYKKEFVKNSHREIGFIAQEVKQQFPELTGTLKDGYLSVDYASMSAVLLQAIKEQQEIITEQANNSTAQQIQIQKLAKGMNEQKKINDQLNSKNTNLENRIQQLEKIVSSLRSDRQ